MNTSRSSAPRASILETARELSVAGAFDVIVAGGGIAGVAAAVGAARNGASVCLLEKTCALGGLATLGNVTVWLPLCDGRGRQIIGGLPEELLKLSVADLQHPNHSAHFIGIPACWLPGGDQQERRRQRYQVQFNPASYLLALEQFIIQAGVKLLYDTRVCAVQRTKQRISHLLVENKSGRTALAGQVMIDASGDADLCFLAGEPTASYDANVLAGWFYYLQDNVLCLQSLSNDYNPANAQGPFYRGDNAEETTAQILGTRALISRSLAELRAQSAAQDIQIIQLPTLPCFRMTRRLAGANALNEKDKHRWLDDTVGLTGDWRQRGPVYSIPWRALSGVNNQNLLVAGRCISVDTTVWDITRAIPTCALTGTVAGVAAAMAAHQSQGNTQALAVADLQERLIKQGFLLDPNLVKPGNETGGTEETPLL